MKIVLAGSPKIAVKTFETIINNFEVVAIITQPDRPKGRGLKLAPTPISDLAKKYGIMVLKPPKIAQIYEVLKSLNYDLLVTFAYGQFICSDILELGSYKPLNIHASLLPKYRGAAPIQYAILNGDKQIGISLIEMTKKIDAGDIYFSDKININEFTTTGQAIDLISDLAAKNIVNWLKLVKMNQVNPRKQGDNFTLSPKITKNMAQLTSDLKAKIALSKIRAFNPFPGAFYMLDNIKRIKIFDASLKPVKNAIVIKFANQNLWVIDYQFENKKRIQINYEKNLISND